MRRSNLICVGLNYQIIYLLCFGFSVVVAHTRPMLASPVSGRKTRSGDWGRASILRREGDMECGRAQRNLWWRAMILRLERGTDGGSRNSGQYLDREIIWEVPGELWSRTWREAKRRRSLCRRWIDLSWLTEGGSSVCKNVNELRWNVVGSGSTHLICIKVWAQYKLLC